MSRFNKQSGPVLLITAILSLTFCVKRSQASDPLPANAVQFLAKHCADCHEGDAPEGDVWLDAQRLSWDQPQSVTTWERIHDVVSRGEMPPKDADQPTDQERQQIVEWLEQQLIKRSATGGTVLRRLNREEYENSIRDLFDLTDFRVPNSFPSDDSEHGFDNIGEALILSPPLLAQYLELATQIADEILPPETGAVVAKTRLYEIGVDGLAESNGTYKVGDRYRITTSKSNAHTAGWPARFEAQQSGVFRITVDASVFQTDKMYYPKQDEPFRLTLYAKQKTEQTYDAFEKIRKLTEFDVLPGDETPQQFTCEVELNKGEAFGIRWTNGPIDARSALSARIRNDRPMHAAMLQLGKDPRKMAPAQYYDETVALMKSDKLDLDDPRLDTPLENRGFGGIGQRNGPQLMVQWFVNEEFRRFGPALDVADVSIEGPLRLIEDEVTRTRKARTARFLGARPTGVSDREYAESVLRRFLTNAFRRPVSDDRLSDYLQMVMHEVGSTTPPGRIQDGLHVAVRRALSSPAFIYRSLQPGKLDDFDLASRLSYFLTSSPPDERLFDFAKRGKLSEPDVLRDETLRLINSTRSKHFVQRFTGQWLGTRSLHDIMPDPRLFFYYAAHRESMTQEVEMLFGEILSENHPIETFIDPGFSYRNDKSNQFYGGELTGKEMQRVELERGGRQGGVLGLAAVMMATANGVDTHPVQRGVWLLENVFGTPTPEPPDNVPAIAADISGATTMRTLVEAHRADASCARCHDKIDPLGMVLENFDPVGRWRDHYPIYVQPADGEEALKEQFYANTGKGTKDGPKIDSVAMLPDGTRLNDVTDLKRYLLENDEIFAKCLTGKLVVYATGRPLSFGDRRVVEQLVKNVRSDGNGFRDLIVAIVQSDAFRAK